MDLLNKNTIQMIGERRGREILCISTSVFVNTMPCSKNLAARSDSRYGTLN